MSQLGGKITVESQLGKGSSFTAQFNTTLSDENLGSKSHAVSSILSLFLLHVGQSQS